MTKLNKTLEVFMNVHNTGLPMVRVTQKQGGLSWVVLDCIPQAILSSRRSLRPFKGSPRSRTSRGPLAHTFIPRNRSFSEVKNLATILLIINFVKKKKFLSSLEKIDTYCLRVIVK